MANKNLAGSSPQIPSAAKQNTGHVNASNCVQRDDSGADFGTASTSGQDGELNAFERFLKQSREQVNEFNERLADEQKNTS